MNKDSCDGKTCNSQTSDNEIKLESNSKPYECLVYMENTDTQTKFGHPICRSCLDQIYTIHHN